MEPFRLLFFLGFAASLHARDCTYSLCNNASAVNPNTCLTHENGTGMSWMNMSQECIRQKGRLFSLPSDDNAIQIFYTSSLINDVTNTTERVAIGLMGSQLGGDVVFLYDKTILANNSINCNNPVSKPCIQKSSSLDQNKCESLGCCWKNSTCSFPGNQSLLEFEPFNMEFRNNVTGRSCVYMEKRNGSFANPEFIGRDCFTTPGVKTSFICEFACNGTFPTRQTVTLINPTSSIGPPVSGTVMSYTTVKGVKNNGSNFRDLNMWLLLIALCSVSS